MEIPELWDDFESKISSNSMSDQDERNYLEFLSNHIHEMNSGNPVQSCEWCLDRDWIIDELLDWPNLYLSPLSEEMQKKVIQLISAKYEKVTDDHIWTASISAQLTHYPWTPKEVFETWLSSFENDFRWVRSDGVDLYEEFPEKLKKIARNLPSDDFLDRAIQVFHEHEFSECSPEAVESCIRCSSLRSEVRDIRER